MEFSSLEFSPVLVPVLVRVLVPVLARALGVPFESELKAARVTVDASRSRFARRSFFVREK